MRQRSLRDFIDLHPWFPSLIMGMLNNRISDPQVIDTKLVNLSKVEAMVVGKSLSTALKARKTAEAGVEQWRVQYPSMVELCETEVFFKPMALAIGKQKLIQAPWGLVFRVAFGSAISFADVATDINAIRMFYIQQRPFFLWASIASIALSVFLQCTFVAVQNHKRSISVQIYELSIVVLCIKPVIDAHRVAVGDINHELCMFDTLTETLCVKVIEM